MSFREKLFLLLSALLFVPALTVGQCVVINEILINGPGGCDGNCSPNTEEWIEFYNTCNQPVDVSCYVMTDGDFTVTFPSGTIIPAHGFVTIGSNNAGFIPTINIGNCGCTAGGGIGVFGNGSEQLILLDNTGAFLDGIVWGSGQFPVNITSSLAGCPNLNANFPSSNANVENLPGGGGQGESIARGCDGSTTWVVRPVAEITPNTSNGEAAVIDFDSSSSIICPNQCIDFTDLTTGDPITWSWSFPGSSTSTSNIQNPTNICYPASGLFDVELTVSNSCGTYTLNVPDFIEVTGSIAPSISASGPIEFCAGSNTVISTTQTGSLQWYWDGNIMPGETSNSITATQSGAYSLFANNNGCTGNSNIINVIAHQLPSGSISTADAAVLCPGAEATLQLTGNFNSFEWHLDGANQSINTTTFVANSAGDYNVVLYNSFGCPTTTNTITLSEVIAPNLSITSSAGNSICPTQNSTLTVNSGFSNYAWSGDFGAIGNNSPSVIINQPGTYTVEITTAENCLIDTSIEISETTISPQITTTDALSFCEGGQALLSSSDSGNIQWLESGNPIPGETNNTLSVDATGEYSISVNDNGCVGNSNIVSVEVFAYPTGSLATTSPLTLCPGESLDITLTGTFDTFEWRKDGGPLANSNTTITISEPGVYNAIVYNEIGCSANTNSIQVNVLNYPAISILSSEGNSICPNELTTLTANAGFSNYTWFLEGSNLNLSTDNIVVDEIGDYSVEILTNENCVLSSNITISQALIPNAQIIPGTNVQTCEEEYTLTATGAQSYQWYMDGGILIGENSAALTVSENGSYSVTATSIEGCTANSVPTDVLFLPALVIELQSSETTPCEGESVSLYVTGSYASYNWSNGQSTPTISVANGELYSVTVTDAIGCEGTAEIAVDYIPLPYINAGEDVLSNCVAGALLEATGEGIITWEENEILYDGSSPIVLVNPERTATFTAIAELNGCTNTDDVTVIVDCNSLFIPNAFSPNDDGINDIFQVRGTGIYEFDLKIFDRWGNIIFQTNDPNDVWTGGIDGYYVPNGVYTYEVKALNIDGIPISSDSIVFGSVLVIR